MQKEWDEGRQTQEQEGGEGMLMQGEYKGYTVQWCDWEKFIIKVDGEVCKTGFMTLADCEKYIDGQIKKEWEHIPVIIRSYRGIHEGVTTSLDADGKSVWVKSQSRRSKERFDSVYLLTPENKRIAARIVELEAESKRLSMEANKQAGLLVPIKASDMKEKV